MSKAYKRWACGLLAAVLVLLAACAAVVYLVDPCLYYRMPDKWEPVFFSERYQGAGLAKNVPADTVLVGTSMAANYRASEVGETFGGSAVRITIPDGYLSEFDQVMDVVFRSQTPKRVVFALDLNILVRDESGVTGAMPEYLYNDSLLDDAKYLLNKDTLYYSLYVLMTNRWGGGQTLDESFTWDEGIWWNHMTALAGYTRPEVAEETADTAAFRDHARQNLAVVESWVRAHPDTEFDIFFPPYSILFWDKTARLGQTDAMLAALGQACGTLLNYDNVKLYGFLMDREIVENLDNYCDYVHHSGGVCRQVLAKMAAGQDRLTAENTEEVLANWRDFVVDYDYDKFWDESFWWKWNETHPGVPA